MKVLYLSNKALSAQDDGTTGTWLSAMAKGLVESGEVVLGNVAFGNVDRFTIQNDSRIREWLVPVTKTNHRNGLPSSKIVREILSAVEEFAPDLVHIWGTEYFWGLLSARRLINRPVLLEMQGVMSLIARVFSGGLSVRDQIACIGLKEMVRRSTIFQGRKRFAKWGRFEKEMITRHDNIAVQTQWVEAQVKAINPGCNIFRSIRAVREPFWNATPWKMSGDPVIFCSAAYSSPFKGLHVGIRAVSILRKRFPSIQLRIAGLHQLASIRRDGYAVWLHRLTKRLGIEKNIQWLGPLSATDIIAELQKCSAFLLPTFVESYCLALAEAMMLGVPSVISYTGGTSCLSKDEESGLFFPPGDEAMCAYQLERVLSDPKLALHLSTSARKVARLRNDPNRVVLNQLEIYRKVLANNKLEHF